MHVKAGQGLPPRVETAIRTPSHKEAALDGLALGREQQIKEKVGRTGATAGKEEAINMLHFTLTSGTGETTMNTAKGVQNNG